MTTTRPTVEFRDISGETGSSGGSIPLTGFGYSYQSLQSEQDIARAQTYESLGVWVALVGIGILVVVLLGHRYIKK